MKKEERVKSQQDFQKIISSKKRINSDNFVIYYLNNEGYDFPRFGIAASKKLGNAVIRVKIRRQVRSMIQHIKKMYTIKSNDYIVIVKQAYLSDKYEVNLQKLTNILIKLEDK